MPFLTWMVLVEGQVSQINVTDENSWTTLETAGVTVGSSVEISFEVPIYGASCGATAASDFADWLVPAAHAASSGLNGFSFESLYVQVADGGITLIDFTESSSSGIIADDQFASTPLEVTLCDTVMVGSGGCDWVVLNGTDATVFDASGGGMLLDDQVVAGNQRGFSLVMMGDSGEMLDACVAEQPETLQYFSDMNLAAGMTLDLIDLSVVDISGQFGEISLSVSLDSIQVTYGTDPVPALSSRGGALLVIGVIALGALILWLPRRRGAV
jgi:hypothetical protein